MVPPPPARAVEDLDGAHGREVFFRPPRFRPSDLGPVHPVVTVALNSTVYTCAMRDVSQNGVAFLLPPGLSVEPGDTLSVVTVSFDQHEAYRGAATVTAVRPVEGDVVVGVSFADTLMNIDDVLHLRDVKTWSHGGTRDLVASGKPWHAVGHADFKSLVGEFRLFLDDAHEALGELENTLPWHVVHGDADSAARGALVEYLRGQFVSEFLRYTAALDDATRSMTPQTWHVLREYSLRFLQPTLMAAPFLHRARHKPLGYPGDFELMRFIYERPFEGSSLFAKALHLASVTTPGAAFIRSRKEMLRTRLREMAAMSAERGTTLRVCSVAAGPAQEVYELLAEADPATARLDIVLFDQDHGALTYAYSRLRKLADTRRSPGVRVTYLHDSIKRLLRDDTIFQDLAPFDAVVCAGLFDYLDTRNATALAGTLARNLAPGGTAYIGNVVPELPTRWLIEMHLDWFVKYKSRDEMLAFARAAAPEATLALVEESTGWNPFVTITRNG